MFETFKLLNKFTFEIVEFSIDVKVKLYPAYYIIIGVVQPITNLGECSICLNKIENDVYKTTCNHTFHRKCYEQWLNYNVKCPLCRSNNEFKKLNHTMEMTLIDKYLTIPERSFQLNLGYQHLKFTCEDFTKLFKSSPVLWSENNTLTEKNLILEPVYKLGNIYLSYYLRNTILFGCNSEINDIITSNIIYEDNILLYLDCNNDKYNKGTVNKKTCEILFSWIHEVMMVLKNTRDLMYFNIMNTEILNIMFTYIHYNSIERKEYQKLACVAMYLVHNKKVELDFFEYISDNTYDVKELSEFADKVEVLL
tara:strand:+ start:661 stop:1587 length:927 start_codon:yes stop_codon:yes gene_type:complete